MEQESRFKRKLHPFIEQYPLEKKQDQTRGTTDAALSLQGGNKNSSSIVMKEESPEEIHKKHIKRRQYWFYRIDEILKPSMGASKYIHDFVHSDNEKFKGKSKKDRIRMALGAYYGAKKKSVNEGMSFDSLQDTAEEFLSFAAAYLDIEKIPTIRFTNSINDNTTFATYHVDEGITLAVNNRHPMDVFRSLAHELVHHKQNEENVLHSESGITGSEHENEANSVAGVIMRNFAKENPHYFSLENISEGLTRPVKGRSHWSVGGSRSVRKRRSSGGSGKFVSFVKSLVKGGKSKSNREDPEVVHQRKLELIRAKEQEKRKTLVAKHKAANPTATKKPRTSAKKAVTHGMEPPKRSLEFHQDAHEKWSDALQKSHTLDDTVEVAGKKITKRKYYTDARDYHAKKIRELSEKEIISLLKKSRANAIPYNILLEVYTRGLDDWKKQKTKLSREEHAFNRVNSFISGGKAAELDKDLFLEEEI